MTLQEVLQEVKPLADACLQKGESFVRGYWEAVEDNTLWQVFYSEDWPHRYIPASLNGREFPIVHIYSKHGDNDGETRLILAFRDEDKLWHLQEAEIRGEDERVIRFLKSILKEWNN